MSTVQEISQDNNTRTIQIHIIPDKIKKPKPKVITIITNRKKPKRNTQKSPRTPRAPRKRYDDSIEALEKRRQEVIEEKEKIEELLRKKILKKSSKMTSKGTILLHVDPSKTLPMLLKDAFVMKVDQNKKDKPSTTSQAQSPTIENLPSGSRIINRSEIDDSMRGDDRSDLFETCSEWAKWMKQEEHGNNQNKK